MISKIKNTGKDTKTVIYNTMSLFILQGTTYLIPLIILPYLIRTLGVENFGLLAFAAATIGFFRGIVSYGFDLTGTKQVSLNRDNKKKLTEIFNAIMMVKLILFFITFFILFLLIIFFHKFQMHWQVFIFTFILVFGDVLFPIWFFQGIEKMKYTTYLYISYKLIYVLLVLFIVKEKADYYLVPLLDSIGLVTVGIVSLIIIKRKFAITFKLPSYINTVYQFKNGWHIFISRVSVILYTQVNTFLLGLLTTNEIVGFYSIAEKIFMAIRGLLGPPVQALFPFLAKKFKESKKDYLILVKKLNLGYIFILILFSFLMYVYSNELVYIVSGNNILETIEVLKIFAITTLFGVGTFYSPLLVIKGENKILSKITFICMIINLLLVYPSIYYFSMYGLAYLVLFVQLIQMILQIKYNKEIWEKLK